MSQEAYQDESDQLQLGTAVSLRGIIPAMARPPRQLVPGGLYHVTGRGNRKQVVFSDDGDCEWFLAILRDVAAKRSWTCHGYCLMPTHYHLLVETREADLSLGMQRLKSHYAQAFNHRHEMSGHLFQGRFHAVLVTSDSHLVELVRYLALNPVRAGLCREPEHWRWSSYRALAAEQHEHSTVTPGRVLEHFHPDPGRARRIIRAFVREPLLERLY